MAIGNRAKRARRMADVRIKHLKEEIKNISDTDTIALKKKEIRRLQDLKSQTRTYSSKTGKKMHTAKQVESGVKRLESLIETKYKFVNQWQKNKFFESKINMGSNTRLQGPTMSGKPLSEEMSGLSKDKIKIFYRETMDIWRGLSSDKDRNKAIMKYYGKSDLEEVFNEVLGKFAKEHNDPIQAKYILDHQDDFTEAEIEHARRVLYDNADELRYQPTVVEAKAGSFAYAPND